MNSKFTISLLIVLLIIDSFFFGSMETLELGIRNRLGIIFSGALILIWTTN